MGCVLTFPDSFGWVNASYVYGLQIVTEHMRRALGTVTPWETFKKITDAASQKEAEAVRQRALAKDQQAGKVPTVERVLATARAGVASSMPHNHEADVDHAAAHVAAETESAVVA